MIDSISKYSTEMLVNNRIIDKEDYDVYFYGMQIVYSTVIKSIGLILSALALGIVKEMIIYLFCFIWLRKYAGGVHADRYITCFLVTLTISALPIILILNIPYLNSIYYIIGSCIVAILLLFKYAPTDTPNKPIYAEQRKILHRKSMYAGITFFSIIIFLYVFVDQLSIYCCIASTALLIEALTLLPILNRNSNKEETQ